jgi:hypothetical protein
MHFMAMLKFVNLHLQQQTDSSITFNLANSLQFVLTKSSAWV